MSETRRSSVCMTHNLKLSYHSTRHFDVLITTIFNSTPAKPILCFSILHAEKSVF